MLYEGKWDGKSEKDQVSNGESNLWCKTDEEKKDREPNGIVVNSPAFGGSLKIFNPFSRFPA